jgi:phage portal protein BeeE
MRPADMQGSETRDAAAREIALAFGVPPMVLGIPGDNTYANYSEANKAFWRETLIPLLTHFYGALGRWASARFGSDVEVKINPDSIPALAEEVQRKWDAAAKADFLTVDEKRELVGYEELDGGTGASVLVEASKVPLGTKPETDEDMPTDDDFGDPQGRGGAEGTHAARRERGGHPRRRLTGLR